MAIDQWKVAARQGHAHLFFFDEAGMSNIPNVQRAWSPLGKPHCAQAGVSRKRVNILGALDYAANTLTHTLQEGNVNRTHVVEFIDQLTTQYADSRPKIVVLDNASIHHHIDEAKILDWQTNHQLTLFYLPPYSPELNPIEILWKQAKYQWRKFTTWTKQDMLHEVSNIFQRYGDEFKISYA